LSPPIAAAQQTTAPTMIAAGGPSPAPRPIKASSNRAVKRMVAIVMPDIGLLDEPTSPAM
jgi:hypothetical protein